MTINPESERSENNEFNISLVKFRQANKDFMSGVPFEGHKTVLAESDELALVGGIANEYINYANIEGAQDDMAALEAHLSLRDLVFSITSIHANEGGNSDQSRFLQGIGFGNTTSESQQQIRQGEYSHIQNQSIDEFFKYSVEEMIYGESRHVSDDNFDVEEADVFAAIIDKYRIGYCNLRGINSDQSIRRTQETINGPDDLFDL